MKKICFILVFNVFGFLSAQNPNYKESIDSLMSFFQKNNAFSGSVLLQKKGEIVYKGEFSNFQNNSDLYKIGSITKIFTSVIAFQLIEERKLSLDTKLSQYFPTIKYAENITVGNMLNHTSGIYNYLEWENYYREKSKTFTHEDILRLINLGKPEFKPGKDSSYSNSNFILLGYIIEEITGKSFTENVKSRITDKIGLLNTYNEASEKEYAKRNTSYIYNGETWKKESETHPTFTFAAGAMISTPEDLTKLMQNLFKGNLVSENSLKQMKETSQTGIGYGLFKTPFYTKIGYGHSGRIDEFHSFVGYFPEDSLGIAILSNGTNIKLNDVVIGVISKYYQTKYNYPDFTEYKSETALQQEKYFGVYKAQLAGLITLGKFQISRAGKNHLFVSMYGDGDNGEKALLERRGENNFYARKHNAEFNFTLNDKGEVTGIQMKQGKQTIKCKKI